MLVVFIAGMVGSGILGTLWYGPLFGSTWAPLAHPKGIVDDGDMTKYIYSMLAHGLVAAGMNYLMKNFTNVHTLAEALQLAALLSLMIFAGQLCHTIFLGKHKLVWAIDCGFDAAILCFGTIVAFHFG